MHDDYGDYCRDDYLAEITEEIEKAYYRVLGEDLIRSELLVKLDAEHEKFTNALPKKIDASDIDAMRDILFWNDMLDVLETHTLSIRTARRLLAMDEPLAYLIDAYKSSVDPCREYDDIRTALDEIEQTLK